ncbi:hypothetical protein CRI77_05845 [Mycolicibacterium duvalii]|uniref:Membrane protein n=1 Tax=Mycolicibacterium duvalii TaxID=39688 RepID=A0A7I7K8T7_9MYCO|nr:DUF4129 domain-containing protein [Mycolicibacterium duvalii]MCV7368250.1 DUF4129 domain-containing protein [Mycolicibacterium duvalii]PEG43280.1 hypothetical protein CRI77_05845 [Mycolicibacterium duvalii]BBX19908.1 membrane protein [Mycolicibacterium duvalii]
MSPVDLDRDAAHDAAQQELGKLIYPRPSLTEQFVAWIDELLYRLTAAAAEVPGGWLTVLVLALLGGAALAVAVRIARRAMRTDRGTPETLFGDTVLSAAEHRAIAERHAAEGDWPAAIRHRVRAVARRLEEADILGPVPGRTATELAAAAGALLPQLADRLATAATAFNDVTYGQRPGSHDQYALIAALDDDLAGASVGVAATTPETRSGWTPVR